MKYQIKDRRHDFGFARVFFVLLTVAMMVDLYVVLMPYYFHYKVLGNTFSEQHSSFLCP